MSAATINKISGVIGTILIAVFVLAESAVLSAEGGDPVSVSCLAAADGGRREFPATIVSLSATIDEAPLRYRRLPNYPIWGRGLIASLNDNVRLIPGEAVQIAFLNR